MGRTGNDKLKSQAAAKVLVCFWQSQNSQLELSQVRQALATSLGELRYEYAREALEQLAQDSESQK